MPHAFSAIYLLNVRGDVLIHRTYRDDVGRNLGDTFRTQILQNKEARASPVHTLGSKTFMYMRKRNVYLVGVTEANANAMLALSFLAQLVRVFESYFGGVFDDEAVHNNFVLIYELLDETIDFGLPQITAPEILKQFITQRGVETARSALDNPVIARDATLQVTGAVGWRREGLRYKKNEVYLDIIESVNALVSASGDTLRADCSGRIVLKCLLSGMPELKLGLNDKLGEGGAAGGDGRGGAPTHTGVGSGARQIALDDVTFHQCVNLGRFQAEKTVSFVPPDGDFELMRYRIAEMGPSLPFKVTSVIKELGRTRLDAVVKLKAAYSDVLTATFVTLRIPVPRTACSASIQVSHGKARWDAAANALLWKMKRLDGGQEATLTAEVVLVSTTAEKKAWSRPPIALDFALPMYTASGLRVLFLKVWDKSGYETVKWVRYLSKAGTYEFRCG